MFATFVAFSMVGAAPAAPDFRTTQGWNVADTNRACAVHAAYQGGTSLSVFALPGQEGIGFLLQNRAWTDLEDGALYPLAIRFDNGTAWSMPALARTSIDGNGPGLFFAVTPGSTRGAEEFMTQFASAGGMDVRNNDAAVERLALTGSRRATLALVECISRLWSGEAANPFRDSDSADTARRI